MNPLKCIVTGTSGNLGSYMAELLLSYGFEVVGAEFVEKGSSASHYLNKNPNFKSVHLDVTDQASIFSLIEKERPDYFFNFAGSAFVPDCWNWPVATMSINTISVLNMLDAILRLCPECRFFNACSSEIFGNCGEYPQTENTSKHPNSIYGVSKNSAREIIDTYRQKYNLFAVSGIFYNQESTERSPVYVTRKITRGVARIKKALEKGEAFEPIQLGDLNTEKDWSFAGDGVEAAFLMTQAAVPKDYIISSGESHTVKEFVEQAFQAAGIEGTWVGEKLNEYYILPNYLADFAEFASQKLVTVDSSLVRSKSSPLLGDNSLIKKELNWQPKVNFKELVRQMVAWDIQGLKKTP